MRKSYRRNTLEENAFPLVVRIETVPRSPPPDVQSIENESLGAPLPKWIHSQTTQAVIEKKDDGDYRGVWLRDQQLERELNYDALLCGILAARICADGAECGRLVQYGLVEANR
ncbi:unnamed protein product [Sphagnum tenellum]